MITKQNPFWPYEEGFSIPIKLRKAVDKISRDSKAHGRGYTTAGTPLMHMKLHLTGKNIS